MSPDSESVRLGTPPAEYAIDDVLVRSLLREQHGDLAELPLRQVDSGWDNVMFRLGDDRVVRLPRRRQAVALVRHEQIWLPRLAPRLPLPISAPLRLGQPGCGYPWPWSIVPWMAGQTVDLAPPHPEQVRLWAEFLSALHLPAPAEVPFNAVRGVPLAERAEMVEGRLARLQKATDDITPALLNVWRRALDTPPSVSSCWLHGDLHSRNVLVVDGRLVGVIDWGDITGGDVATDLASFWTLFDHAEARAEGLAHYGATAAQIRRAKGWAVLFGAVLLASGLVDHPAHAKIGRQVLRRLTEDV